MGRVRFTSVLRTKWLPKTVKELEEAVLDMMTDIHREASILAPKDTRVLVNSGRIARLALARYAVIFGGNGVEYALRRHFENKLHPGSLEYLERPGDRIARGGIKKYLRRI